MWCVVSATSIAGRWVSSTCQRQNVPQGACRRSASYPLKKDAGPRGPASQTGRLHVWETWDHEDPEFRTRSAETARVEDLESTYPSLYVLLGGNFRTLACEGRMSFIDYAILHV